MYFDTEAIGVLKEALKDPWLLVFGVLWVIGYLLKNHTDLDNNRIPFVVLALGIAIGLWVIELSFFGGAAGFLIGAVAIGIHSAAKNTVQGVAGMGATGIPTTKPDDLGVMSRHLNTHRHQSR